MVPRVDSAVKDLDPFLPSRLPVLLVYPRATARRPAWHKFSRVKRSFSDLSGPRLVSIRQVAQNRKKSIIRMKGFVEGENRDVRNDPEAGDCGL
jgi:hypothetical protein